MIKKYLQKTLIFIIYVALSTPAFIGIYSIIRQEFMSKNDISISEVYIYSIDQIMIDGAIKQNTVSNNIGIYSSNNKVSEENHIQDLNNIRLRIDTAEIEGPIVQGKNSDSMLNGFWLFPNGSKAFQKGNTVIIGHRYDKVPPAKDTFFNLDKVDIGNILEISFIDEKGESKMLKYRVINRKVVPSDAVDILNPNTNIDQVTLVTCWPLWSSAERLVIVATIDKIQKKV